MIRKLLLSLILGLGLCYSIYAQKTDLVKEPQSIFDNAKELFNEQKYGAAYSEFSKYIELNKDFSNLYLADAYYSRAICGAILMNNDADKMILEAAKLFPYNSRVHKLYFYLANYYQQKNEFAKAIFAYNQVNPGNLTKDDRLEYYYKTGYCYFMQGDLTKAKTSLTKVKDSKSKYSSPATYYFAHILYEEKKYELALRDFLSLRKDRNFGGIVPYYIVHIYYLQGKYQELVKLAPELSSSSNSKRTQETNRMLGEAYCKLNQFEEAIPYLEKGVKDNPAASVDDNYLLGYSLCKNNKFEEAIPYLSKAIDAQDTLAQHALYNLGYCYINIGDKHSARSKFQLAYNMNFDPTIKEDALLNYAKLSYELPNPFNETIKSFQSYLNDYPKSKKIPEVKEYLAQLYGASKNYADAIKIIEEIPNRSKSLNQAYQRIAINRGIEIFNEGKYSEAVELFTKSLKYPFDDGLTAAAYYLRGDAMFRLDNFEGAVKNLNSFYAIPKVEKSIYYPKADYSMAYAYFKQKKYSLAMDYFKRYLKDSKSEDAKLIADAHNRIGDCYYMAKDFSSACSYYDKAIDSKLIDIDYATYQKALCIGAQGRTEQKADILQKALTVFPKSNYTASMLFELANCYLILEMNEKALETYDKIVQGYPQSIHTKASLGKIGLIYYKIGKDDLALSTLDKLVKGFPSSEESKAGLMNIRTIYVERDKVDDYYAYVKTIPNADFSNSEQDSITYQAIENRYMNGDCNSATAGFKDYLHKFPNGYFAVNANYYLGDCLNKSGQLEEALKCYLYVCNSPKSKFTEKSILNAANLSYSLKEYKQANILFSRLEKESEVNTHTSLALLGKMRTYFLLNDADSAIIASKEVIKAKKNTQEIIDEATYIIAKSNLSLGNTKQALDDFQKIKKSKNGEYAAEANYLFAEHAFKENKYSEAEKIILGISANPTSEYWLAKSFILWGDIFTNRKQYLQAKQTYQSIIENYDGEDLINIAQEKVNAILAIEEENKRDKEIKAKEKKEEIDEIIIDSKPNNTIEENESDK